MATHSFHIPLLDLTNAASVAILLHDINRFNEQNKYSREIYNHYAIYPTSLTPGMVAVAEINNEAHTYIGNFKIYIYY